MTEEYKAPQIEKELEVINTYELEDLAKEVIPKGGFDYIAGGAGDELTLENNLEAFKHKGILQRVLAGVENPDLSTSILGTDLPVPFIMSPIAAHGLANEAKEAGTAKAFSAFQSIMSISSYSGANFDELEESLNGGTNWFQLYVRKQDEQNKAIIDEAKKLGANAIILTADTTMTGNREADLRNKFNYPFGMPIVERSLKGKREDMLVSEMHGQSKVKLDIEDVRFLSEYSNLPIIVKGIQTPEDALKAIGGGASAVWVSNHGGRQLDGGPGSYDMLAEISDAVNGSVPIIFDSGIRRGEHIFKAIASGADIVGLGRPILYGLALGGSKGVTSVLEYFEKDLKRVMQLAGAQSIEDIKKARLYDMK